MKERNIKHFSLRFVIFFLINTLFQLISMLTRYKYQSYIRDFVPNVILNLDYIFLLIITQKIVIKKGDVKECTYQEEVGSSSRKKINLKKSLQKLQKNYQSNL